MEINFEESEVPLSFRSEDQTREHLPSGTNSSHNSRRLVIELNNNDGNRNTYGSFSNGPNHSRTNNANGSRPNYLSTVRSEAPSSSHVSSLPANPLSIPSYGNHTSATSGSSYPSVAPVPPVQQPPVQIQYYDSFYPSVTRLPLTDQRVWFAQQRSAEMNRRRMDPNFNAHTAALTENRAAGVWDLMTNRRDANPPPPLLPIRGGSTAPTLSNSTSRRDPVSSILGQPVVRNRRTCPYMNPANSHQHTSTEQCSW